MFDFDKDADKWIIEQEERINEVLEDAPGTSLLEELTPQRKEYLRFMLGHEDGPSLTFDPSRIPTPSDFTKRMDAYYERQIAKGAVRVKRADPVKKQAQLQVPVVTPRKDKKYSWIPISEIHTARTKIDSLLYLTPAEKKELHEKFARQVSCLISQFDAIGNVDDDSITPDQSAALTSAFSEALVELQNQLFQPISRQHALARRGPLFQKRKSTFEGRHIKYRNRHTLGEIAANSRKKTSQLEKGQKRNEDLLIDRNAEHVEHMLPPAYRPPPIGAMPRPDKLPFMLMSKKIREEMEKVDEEHKKRPKTAQSKPPRKRNVDILMTPRKTVQTPVAPKKPPPKPPRSSTKPAMSFEYVRNPENAFFEVSDYQFEPIAGVETGSCLEGIERLFAPLKPQNVESARVEEQIDPIAMPPSNQKKPEAKETNYIFKPDLKRISELLDVSHLFGQDMSETVEHQSLTQLWEQLGLHPDTRLLMAAKLCNIVTDDASSDYHFQAIVGATNDFKRYNKAYKKYRDALNYEPDIESEETAAYIARLATKYKVAEDAFRRANQEMVHVLGNEILTKKGPISTLIEARADKIRRWRAKCGIDKVPAKNS